jgi:hypothetical protein
MGTPSRRPPAPPCRAALLLVLVLAGRPPVLPLLLLLLLLLVAALPIAAAAAAACRSSQLRPGDDPHIRRAAMLRWGPRWGPQAVPTPTSPSMITLAGAVATRRGPATAGALVRSSHAAACCRWMG